MCYPLASRTSAFSVIFFFNDPATTEIYTLSLHDALPIYDDAMQLAHDIRRCRPRRAHAVPVARFITGNEASDWKDRKSTRLNSSHANISYAVFCLKKKNQHGSPGLVRRVDLASHITSALL